MVSEKLKVILDCDPGHDDAVAIMLAAKHPKIDLLAITTVAGNQTLEKTTKNALKVCSYLGITDVPIAAGMARPLVRDQIIADNIHGETGLDGPVFGEPTLKVDTRHAVDLIIELLLNSEGDIHIVPTGPLTNIAMALRREPKILPKIKKIVLMGGSYQLGNVTPCAEFNIFADPEAAHIVFNCGRPIVMIGLDVTRKARVTKDVIEKMRGVNNKASKLFLELMEFFGKTQREVFGWDGPPLHDPVTIAYLIDPSLLKTKLMHTEIELRSTLCYGRTVCDYFGVTGKEPNVEVAVDIDTEKYWEIIRDTLEMYN